jgi:hypothetical protein
MRYVAFCALGGDPGFTGGLVCYDVNAGALVGGLQVPPEEACFSKAPDPCRSAGQRNRRAFGLLRFLNWNTLIIHE